VTSGLVCPVIIRHQSPYEKFIALFKQAFLEPVSVSQIYVFCGYLLVVVVLNKLHHLPERDSRLAHYFGLFWGLWLLLGYLASSGAKSDIIFLLSDHVIL